MRTGSSALRYRERQKAKLEQLEAIQASETHHGQDGESQRLRAQSLDQADTIAKLSKDRDILTGKVRVLEGSERTIKRLQADLAVRDAEIDRLKAELARAQEKVDGAARRESGYREQIARLESRPGR